jgi:hypothetical protein
MGISVCNKCATGSQRMAKRNYNEGIWSVQLHHEIFHSLVCRVLLL